MLDTNFSIDSIYFFSCSRKRRGADNLVFKAEHIIIISIKEVPNADQRQRLKFLSWIQAQRLSLPAKAFTPKALKTVILEMEDSDLPYILKSVDDQPKRSTTEGLITMALPVKVVAVLTCRLSSGPLVGLLCSLVLS